MVELGALSGIYSGDAVIAQPVTHNFSIVALAVNSSALNSLNYKASGAYSNNIVTNAILSQHFSSAPNIPYQKIGAGAVLHSNLIFGTTDAVSALRIGIAASNLPANGIRVGVYTTALTLTTESNTLTFACSAALWGNPSFTTTPIPFGQPACVVGTGTEAFGIGKAKFFKLLSSAGTIEFLANYVANTESVTIHWVLAGAV